MSESSDLESIINNIRWFHTIDLGNGLVTKGAKSSDVLRMEAESILGPIFLQNATVADIGAWNGFFSVECKRRGASRVVAVDDFTWSHPDFRGRESIEIVKKLLNVDIVLEQVDIAKTSVNSIGAHDVVLLLGVFYHLFDAQTDLLRVAECAKDLLIVETHQDALDYQRPAMVFYPGGELGNDETNWWGPNPLLMYELLLKAGFEKVYYRPHPTLGHRRGIYHAFRNEHAKHKLARTPGMDGSLDMRTFSVEEFGQEVNVAPDSQRFGLHNHLITRLLSFLNKRHRLRQ